MLGSQAGSSQAGRSPSMYRAVQFLDPLRLHYGGYRNVKWHIEELLKSRVRKKALSYLVKWYGRPQPSWESCSDLINCNELLARFHHEHPRARGWRWAAKRLSPSTRYSRKVFEEHLRLSELENERRSLADAYGGTAARRTPAAVDTASVRQCSSPSHEPTALQWSRVGNTDWQSASASPKSVSVDGTHGQADALSMRDVGLSCISPGFSTRDPRRREQLRRSVDIQQRQREIIAARSAGPNQPCEFREDDGCQNLLGRHAADLRQPHHATGSNVEFRSSAAEVHWVVHNDRFGGLDGNERRGWRVPIVVGPGPSWRSCFT